MPSFKGNASAGSDQMKRTQELSPILVEFAVIFVFDRPLPLTECGRDHAPICIASHEDDAIDQAG